MMPAPKYAKSVDKNQAEIVEALRAIGCDVVVIGKPVDLLVGYTATHGVYNLLLEVKRPGEKPRTDEQKKFLRTWKGQVRVVQSAQEAIDLVLGAYVTHYEPVRCPHCNSDEYYDGQCDSCGRCYEST